MSAVVIVLLTIIQGTTVIVVSLYAVGVYTLFLYRSLLATCYVASIIYLLLTYNFIRSFLTWPKIAPKQLDIVTKLKEEYTVVGLVLLTDKRIRLLCDCTS